MTQRLFIAFELPDQTVSQIVAWMRANMPPNVNPEPSTNLHQTLAFLGDTEDEMVPQIAQAIQGLDYTSVSIRGPVEYRELDKLGMLVFQDEGGQAIFEQLNERLFNLTGYKPNFTPWLSHSTVWRYAPENKPNLQIQQFPRMDFVPTGIYIMKSEKIPTGGAQYIKVADFAWSDLAITHGHGMAFYYDPESGLYWDKTHYMIFANMPKDYVWTNFLDSKGRIERGIFGWIFPDWYGDNRQRPDYDIDFGTDFGMDMNRTNPHLVEEAVQAIEEEIGYPAINISSLPSNKQAGHDVEPDDQNWQLADSTYDFPSREAPSDICTNCGSLYAGDFCQDCGDSNMDQWTPLDIFKGSIQKNAAINVNGKYYSCFGFLNGILYLGSRHHMGIMQALIDHGWTWDQLVNANQLWGWCGTLPNKDQIHLSYTTDAARLDRDLDEELKEVFGSLTHKPVESSFGGASNEEYAPTWNSLYGPEGIMKNTPAILVYDYRSGSEVIWQEQDIKNREVNPDAPPDWEEEDW